MIQTVEAVVNADGRVRLLGEVHVSGPRRALVMVLEEPATVPGEATLLVEAALAEDWSRPRGRRRVVAPAAGEVVLIPFPFSDLSQTKVRPAICPADAGRRRLDTSARSRATLTATRRRSEKGGRLSDEHPRKDPPVTTAPPAASVRSMSVGNPNNQ